MTEESFSRGPYGFTSDTLALVRFFIRCRRGKREADGKKQPAILDIGTGNGIIPVLLASEGGYRNLTAVEIQEGAAALARQNFAEAGIASDVTLIHGDVRELKAGNRFDVVISNPPYMAVDGRKTNLLEEKARSRHELSLTLEDLVASAKRLLKPVGKLYLVYKTARFPELLQALAACHFAPGRTRFVYGAPGKPSHAVLIEAGKGKGGPFTLEEPLYLNSQTEEEA